MSIHTINLPEALTQNYANELHAMLCECYETSSELILDASRVEQLSTAVMQVLLSGIQTFSKANKKIEIKNVSKEFIQISTLLGINNLGVK